MTTLKTNTKPKLIVPKHVWDTKTTEKQKKELEKVPRPTGWRTVSYTHLRAHET